MTLVKAKAGDVSLEGFLTLPDNTTGVVLFAHGSGSSRHSPRNQMVAKEINSGGIGTLLIDLLTVEEEQVDIATRELRFDIPMLADRVAHVVDWLHEEYALPIGICGSSTGAAAALVAAAERPALVRGVISRGGRPDLAGQHLPKVQCPTLLIVGGDDTVVIGMNEEAKELMSCECTLSIIPGATHLFEEPGTLEAAAKQAKEWFIKTLS